MSIEDDARNAVFALLRGDTDGKYGDFYIRDAEFAHTANYVALRYPKPHSGWALRVIAGEVEWWPAFDAWEGHSDVVRAFEQITGIELRCSGRRSAAYTALGPLGLAALRASLDLTPTTTTVVEEGTTT